MVTGAANTELRLSLDEAVQRALENNADIAVARFDPSLSEQNVFSAKGYYDPQLYSTLYHQSTDTKGTNAFSGGTTVNTKTDVWNFGAYLPVQTGGSVQLDFNNNKRDTNNSFTTFNPVYNSGLTLTLRQPLLRNFKIDQPRYALRVAKKNREISDVQFRQTVISTVAIAKDYYYQLIYSIDALGAAQKSLQLAQRLLDENEIRVKVGTMAPLDVVAGAVRGGGPRGGGHRRRERPLRTPRTTSSGRSSPRTTPRCGTPASSRPTGRAPSRRR